MNLGKFLHKVGDSAFAHPWRFISAWVVILALLGTGAYVNFQEPSTSISIPGTQAQQTIDRVSELFPDNGGATGRIVFHATNGKITDHRDDINDFVKEVENTAGVSEVISPMDQAQLISDDKTIAFAQVQLDGQVGSIDEATIESVAHLVDETKSDALEVEVGGDLVSQVPGEILGVGEIIGVGIALLVLIVTFGSLVAGGMPILSAILAVGVSTAALFALSHVVDINSTTPTLAVMLGLAVGIDYTLFIISKYRSLLTQGYKERDAAGRALGTAGNAVVFAAITVIIALSALSVVNIPFMTTMGLAGAGSIAVAALVSLTLTPALLRLAGAKIFGIKQRRKQKSNKVHIDKKGVWYKWGHAVVARPVVVIVASLAVIGILAAPLKDLTLGLPTDQYAAVDSSERKAYDLLAEGFGVGFNSPLVVLVEDMPEASEADRTAVRKQAMSELNAQVAAETKKQQAIIEKQLMQAQTIEEQMMIQQQAQAAAAEGEAKQQAALKNIDTQVDQYAKFVQLNKVAEAIAKQDNVDAAVPASVTDNGSAGIIQVIPKSAPADHATTALIDSLRSESTRDAVVGDTNATLAVTGSTALQNDINQKLADALPVYLMTIVGLSLVLLLVAFRSVLIPIKATLGYALSVAAMLGVIVAIFQWGWFGLSDAPGPIVSFVPIIAAGILFGLAMDYEFFLVSGMQEAHHHTKNARKSVVDGFAAGAKVVTAAAIIMISVFAAFITNGETVIQTIGFGLAAGILVDAFIVRMLIVPAIMGLLGDAAWWLPSWLDKILPHVSIEGEAE